MSDEFKPGRTAASPRLCSLNCAACGEAIEDHYFEINRTAVCDPCRESIEAQLRGAPGLPRFARSLGFGMVGAIAATALYSAFLSYSAIDLALVAMVVGDIVGWMVRKGSKGLGGTMEQLLAVALTYLSLAMTYFTITLIDLLRGQVVAGPVELSPAVVLAILHHAVPLPFLRMKSSPIQILFVGFALWRAWNWNRPRPLRVSGPHELAKLPGADGT